MGQAICFMQSGATYVPAKPWDNTSVSKMVREVNLLPETVQQAIEKMLDGLERSDS